MPKVLIPCPGGHGIAFVYPSIPCLELCVSWMGFCGAGGERGTSIRKYDTKKNTSRATGKAAVEGSEHEY